MRTTLWIVAMAYIRVDQLPLPSSPGATLVAFLFGLSLMLAIVQDIREVWR